MCNAWLAVTILEAAANTGKHSNNIKKWTDSFLKNRGLTKGYRLRRVKSAAPGSMFCMTQDFADALDLLQLFGVGLRIVERQAAEGFDNDIRDD